MAHMKKYFGYQNTVHALLCCYCVPFSVLLGPDRRLGACVTVGPATAVLLSLLSVIVTKPYNQHNNTHV